VMSQEPYKGHNFHLLGHSMGGVVNYLATTLSGFPIDSLKTVVTLNSPL
jgi:alpha-beta hydrolase superfamily lysophospholipase